MKKSKFTEEQIAYALRLAKSGTPVGDVCRQMGVSEATLADSRRRRPDEAVARSAAAAHGIYYAPGWRVWAMSHPVLNAGR